MFVSISFAFILPSLRKYFSISLPFPAMEGAHLLPSAPLNYNQDMVWNKNDVTEVEISGVSCDADSSDVLLKQTPEKTHDAWREYKQDLTVLERLHC